MPYKDLEARAAYMRKWAEAHRQERAAYNKKYFQESKGLEQRAKQREADRRRKGTEKRKRSYVAASHKRRALVAGNGGSYTQAQFDELLKQFNRMCAYCQERPFEELDHDIPVSRGGNSDISNLIPACSPCNKRKNKKTALEFIWQINT
jgi:5-methylcytosine-specific restriction endonuclease McrA